MSVTDLSVSTRRHDASAGLITLLVVIAAVGALARANYSPGPRLGWTFDGAVFDAARSGNVVYLGGGFTSAAPVANEMRYWGEFRTAGSATPARTWPAANGTVNSVEPDGAGGYYLGGLFTAVGGSTRSGLAHVLADGSLDPTFAPSLTRIGVPAATASVLRLARLGNVLYVGGNFNQVNGITRQGAAAFDLTTGQLLPWDANLSTGGFVWAFAFSGNTAFLTGGFSSAGGVARTNMAAVNATTGALVNGFTANLNDHGYSLTVSPSGLFVLGFFTTVNGTTRSGIAKVDLATGAVLTYVADVNAGSGAYKAIVSGATVYVGGGFTTVNGILRRGLVATDVMTGAVLPLAVDVHGTVMDLELSGTTVYISGRFTRVVDAARANLAAVSVSGAGALLPWNPGASQQVVELALAGPSVVVAGAFTHYGAIVRQGLAAIDLGSGELTGFNHGVEFNGVSGSVRDVAITAETLYVGGLFTAIDGVSRTNLAAIALRQDSVTAWNPPTDAIVSAVETDGASVLVGGSFTTVKGVARNQLAAVDAQTGDVLPWNPGVTGPSGSLVFSIVRTAATTYIGGSFTHVGGQPRIGLAAVDSLSGAVTAFNPGLSNAALVRVLKLVGSTLYVGGRFQSVGGAPRTNAAAVQASTGALLPFAPQLPNTGDVNDIDVDDIVVYLAGRFATVNGAERAGLAAVDLTTGQDTYPFVPATTGAQGETVRLLSGLLLAWVSGEGFSGQNLATFPHAWMGGRPGAPSTPTVLVTNGASFTMRWTPGPLGGNVISYLVEASTVPGGANIGVLPTAGPFFSYSGVPPGRYFLRVRAVNANGASEPSGEIGVVFGDPACGSPPLRLDTRVRTDNNNLSLAWDEPVGSPGTYFLEAGSAPGLSNLAAFGTGTTRSLSAAVPPGAYYMRLTADSACGRSAVGPDTGVLVGGYTEPDAPVVSTTLAGGSLTVSWTAVPGATAYRLEAGWGPLAADLASLTVAGTSLTAPAVPSGTYFIRVRALTPTGTSQASNEAVAIVP